MSEAMTNRPSRAAATPAEPARDPAAGVYGITTAAELVGMSVQALRLYERKGLLEPARTSGGTRRYSEADIVRLRRIAELIADGINLVGIVRVLGLEATNADLHADNAGLRTRNTRLANTNSALRANTTDPDARNVPPRSSDHRPSPSNE
jgi:DNA-binding transcriptional MerR regulator